MRRLLLAFVLFVLAALPLQAQDGFNLPTELYVLLNTGVVERYGLGTSGIERVTPEDKFVLDIGVAPDGTWIAYRTEDGLFIDDTSTESAPDPVEDSRASVPYIRGRGDTLAWSPAADAIAYTTLYGGRVALLESDSFSDLETPGLLNLIWSPDGSHLAAEAENNVWWIFRRESTGMVLASAITQALGTAWVDGVRLLFAPPDGGLTLMDMSASNAQTSLLDPFRVYSRMLRLPDGSIRLFGSEPGADGTLGRLLELRFVEGTPALEEIGTAPIDLGGLSWTPGGSLMIALRGGVLALVNPVDGQGITLPVSGVSAVSWGPIYPPPVSAPVLPQSLTLLAPNRDGVLQVWRVAGDGSAPVQLTEAEADITAWALGPDGRRLAYISNSALWLQIPDNDAVELLTLGDAAAQPVFSPDGRTIYFEDERDGERGIWQVSTEVDEVEAVAFRMNSASLQVMMLLPADDVGAALLLGEDADGTPVLSAVDLNTGQERPLGTFSSARWTRGTVVLALSPIAPDEESLPGLYRLDINRADLPPTPVLPSIDRFSIIDYAAVPEGGTHVLIRQREPGPLTVLAIPSGGGVPEVSAELGFLNGATLSRDGSVAAGLTRPGGYLMVQTLNGEGLRLAQPEGVVAFRWR